MRILIAEDMPAQRRRMVGLVQRFGCEVAAELEDGAAVMDWLRAGGSADACILDVEMPGATGLEVARAVGLPPVVFVTGSEEHGRYALQAWSVEAFHFLLKPVKAADLEAVLDRLKRRLGFGRIIPASAGGVPCRVDVAAVTHFDLDRDGLWAWSGGRHYETDWRSLAEVERDLAGEGLVRVNRTTVVRLAAVDHLLEGGAAVRLRGGVEVEVSRRGGQQLMEALEARRREDLAG